MNEMSFFGYFRSAFESFNDNDGWVMSSHVSMSMMMSAFPFLIFAASLAGFTGSPDRTQDIISLVFEYWPAEVAEPITKEIDVVLSVGNAKFLTIGIVLALYFGSNGIEAIRTALNRAYQDIEPSPWWRQRLVSLIYALVLALVLLTVSILLVVVPAYLALLSNIPEHHYRSLFTSGNMRLLISLTLLTLAVFASHYWLPGRRREVMQILPGVGLTMIAWIIAALGFSAYLRMFANYSATYAGLAGVMTALIFLYCMSAILIYGAELNAVIERTRSNGPAR